MGSSSQFSVDVAIRCSECASRGSPPETVLDTCSGDLICTGCGLVLEDHFIDEGRDWRNFLDEGHEADRVSKDHTIGTDELGLGVVDSTGICGGSESMNR